MTLHEIIVLQCCETSHHYRVMPVYVRRGLAVTKLTKTGLKSCFPQYPGRMLYATKIEDRHLGEQQLFEMAAFYMQSGSTLTMIIFDLNCMAGAVKKSNAGSQLTCQHWS